MGTNHQQGVKKLQCRLQSLELCHIQLIWVQSLCFACRLRKFPWAGQFFTPLPCESWWVDGERMGRVSSGWVGVTGGKMEGEDQWGSMAEKKRCKSQRELKRQNERASVVSCVLSSLGLASSLSGFNLKLMIYSWEGWKRQTMAKSLIL